MNKSSDDDSPTSTTTTTITNPNPNPNLESSESAPAYEYLVRGNAQVANIVFIAFKRLKTNLKLALS